MEGSDSPDLDAGRALQQMELVAWEEGLGTCFVGLPTAEQQRAVKDLLGVPDSTHPGHRPAVRLPRPDTPRQEAQAPLGDRPRREIRSALRERLRANARMWPRLILQMA